MAVNFGDSFNIGAFKPIDVRLVVNTVANLTDGTIQYPYKGMLVSVKNDNGFVKTYRLTTEPLNSNPIPLNSWEVIGQAGTLASLSDVQLGTVNAGDVLLYGTNAKWTNRGPIVQSAAAGTNGNIVFTFSDGTVTSIQVSGGELEDTNYSSNFFIVDGQSYNASLSVLDSILGAIAPQPAANLTSTSLTLNVTQYSAKVPSGLSAAWLPAAGSTISNYIINSTYTLTSPSPATEFNAGPFNNPATYGTVSHLRNASTFVSRNMTSGIGNNSNSDANGNSTLTVSSIALYNSIWAKANANILYVQNVEGTISHSMSSTVAGTTNTTTLNLDNVNTLPSFSSFPSISTGSIVIKYLSGIEYYGIGSTISLSYTAASGIFNRCYHPTAVSSVNGSGFPTFNLNPVSTPNYTDTFIVSSHIVTLSTANYSSGASPGQLTVTLQKPSGLNATDTENYPNLDAISARVNTYGTVSTGKFEGFLDEANRLIQNTNTAFDSTVPLANGEAQVLNGSLVYGDTDYPTKSGDQRYDRKFTVSPQQNGGSMTFAGFTPSNIGSYNTGNINMFLQLDTNGLYYDLGRPIGSNNGTGDGSSLANSIGAKVSTSGSTLNYTFGVVSTFPTNQYRMIIIFKNNTYSITSITIA